MMINEDEEKLAHENWYKNNDPIAYKFYRDLSPEFETDFYTSEIAWLARAKVQLLATWISVKDEEPPLDKMVLVCWSDAPDIDPEIDYMTVDEDLNHIWANYDNEPPSHWMYFHKVPQESGAEQ